MAWVKLTSLIDRVIYGMAGYSECRGVFCIVDEQGRCIDGVQISYRVGNGEWAHAGVSRSPLSSKPMAANSTPPANFIQPFSIFYRIGDSVSWRFSRDGYLEYTLTRYTAGLGAEHNTVAVTLKSGYS